MDTKESNFYVKLREKIKNWEKSETSNSHEYLEYILALPDFFYVIWKLAFDNRIPSEIKLKLFGLIVYWIIPLDLLPEVIFGPFGFLDDLALSVMLLHKMMENHGDIIKEYWNQVSTQDILTVMENIISDLDRIIGSGLWSKLKSAFGTIKS